MRRRISNKSSTLGLGICDVVCIVFIILKLLKIIDWSWVWVLSPLWISILLYIIIFLIIAIYHVIVVSAYRRGSK